MLLFNEGNGTFAEDVDFVTGASPWAVTAADLDGDGRPDLAVTHFDSTHLAVMLNTCLP